MRTTYQNLKQGLPQVENFQGFLAAQQGAITQLAAAFCDAMVVDTSLRTAFFGTSTFADLSTSGGRTAMIDPAVNKVLGLNLASQPDPAQMRTELDALITNTAAGRAQGLCVSTACNTARTEVVAKAVCASVLASAATVIQ
jgi:hypothetical protein